MVCGILSRCHCGLAQGVEAVFVLGMANDDGVPLHGLLGMSGLFVNHLLIPGARAYRLRAEAMLRNTQLRSKPNVV